MQKKSQPGSVPASARRSTPWHAVSVVTGRGCCDAARGLPTIRYLSRDAPRLPLIQCSSPEACACAYRHHLDRRGPPRRKDELRGIRGGLMADDRRTLPGRREDD